MRLEEVRGATPRDLLLMMMARDKIEEREMERLAWQTAHIMNSSGMMKQPVTTDQLLGRKTKPSISKKTYEAMLRRRGWA